MNIQRAFEPLATYWISIGIVVPMVLVVVHLVGRIA